MNVLVINIYMHLRNILIKDLLYPMLVSPHKSSYVGTNDFEYFSFSRAI